MKKFLAILFSAVLLIGSFGTYAADSRISVTDNIMVSKGQKEVVVPITISVGEEYAGAEFAVECPNGAAVKRVEYDLKNAASTAPTQARGYTWFSYFSGSNDFKGDVKANVTLSLPGDKDTNIILYSVSIFFKNKAIVDKQELELNKNIAIKIKSDSPESSDPPVSSEDPVSSSVSSDTSSSGSTSDISSNSSVNSSDTSSSTVTNSRTTASSRSSSSSSSTPNTGDDSMTGIIMYSLCLALSFLGVLGCVIIYVKNTNEKGKKDEKNEL